MNRRQAALGVVAAMLLGCGCVSRSYEPVGGSWRVAWDTSAFAEAGGHHPSLERREGWRHVLVMENSWRTRYLEDDCVLFGEFDQDPVYAACGGRQPLALAPRISTGQGDRRFHADPVELLPGFAVSVAEIKRRAGLQPARPASWRSSSTPSVTLEAAVSGKTSDVQAALAKGASANAPDRDGHPPLFWAVLWGHTDVVDALLAAGAEPRLKDAKDETALFLALRAYAADPPYESRASREAALRALLAAGADPLAANRDNVTALSLAARLDVPEGVFVTMLARAKPHQQAEASELRRRSIATRKLLAMTDVWATPDAVSALLREGADPNAHGFEGRTALMTAAERPSADTVLVLLAARADPSSRSDQEGTPLETAAAYGNLAAVRALLAAGADPNARRTTGETAVYWAANRNHADCLKALLDAGGSLDVTVRAASSSQPVTLDQLAASDRTKPEVAALIKKGRAH
jgi:ankyrin repeat protein